jgi:hypothetical protein
LLPAVLFFAACDNGEPTDCSTLPDVAARNSCQLHRVLVLGPEQIDLVLARIDEMADPVARGAAVFGWIEAHPNALTPAQGQELCAKLKDENKRICERRHASSHLSRP